MIRIRRGIAAIALLWLSAQGIAFTATAFVPALVAGDAECTCGDNGGVMCPMHHRRPLGSAHCAMRSVPSDPATPAIWCGTPGIPAMAILTIAPAPVRSMLPVFVATRFGASLSPEPPPPRA